MMVVPRRHAQHAVEAALADTRVVVVLGARQVGKSTLLEQVAVAEGAGREVVTLDNQAIRAAATTDPAGFIATLDTPVAIDEIQRVCRCGAVGRVRRREESGAALPG